MQTPVISSKAEKKSNRAAQKRFYHYGKAMLFGYFEITKGFASGNDAIQWLAKVQSGWRAKIYDAHIYYDKFGIKPMVKGYDAFRFAWIKKHFGIQEALRIAQEGWFQ